MTWIGFENLWTILGMGGLLLSGYIILRFHQSIQDSIATAPQLEGWLNKPLEIFPTIAVIIPAYNEAVNIRDCVESVLQSDLPSSSELQVWIADDESTDETAAIAQALVAQDARVRLLSVPPRPTHEIWMGKNWACTQAADQSQSEYLLFLDADVRLEKGAIATALTAAQSEQADLLSCIPNVVCGCLAEWLAQPLIFRILIASFNIGSVNDPAQPDVAFAAGPFMLFRRTAYDKIGGHRAVADNLVEDVALAQQIKAAGLTMRLMLALDLVKVRMYRSLSSLWEGWTKNLHMGSRRKVSGTLMVALIALGVLTVPWLGLSSVIAVWCGSGSALLGGTSVGLFMLSSIRWQRQARLLKQPVRYWALSGLGGLLVAAIAIGSIIKTETGWGWTWRGRPLSIPASREG